MEHTQEDDELTGIYGQFFGEDGQARTEAPIPIAKLVQLFRTSDPRIRSKVARMVGRYSQYQSFVARRLQEDDPRVRANAIESLWGVDTEVARRFLETAVADAHHRARANAIYGLYLLGNPSSIPLLVKQSNHPSPLFRAAALWVVTQTADPRFLGLANALSADSDESVRRNAATAATRIQERMEAERRKPSFRMRILRARGPDPEWRTVRMLLPREVSNGAKGTDFIIEENGYQVHRFEVSRMNIRHPLRVGIAVPEARPNSTWVASAETAIKPWLTAGSSKDAFSIFRYSPGANRPTYTAKGLRAVFATRPDIVADQLAMQVPSGDLSEAVTELAGGLSVLDVERGLIVFAEIAPGADATWLAVPSDLVLTLRSNNVPVHAVVSGAAPGSALEATCAKLGGVYECADTPEGIAASCSTIFNSFSDRYEVRYVSEKHADPGATVKVTVYSPAGWAEQTAVLL